MDSVQSPGVPSTGHPEAFFLLSQMPAGVASFSYRANNKNHFTSPAAVHQAPQTLAHHRGHCISPGPALLDLHSRKLWLSDGRRCGSVFAISGPSLPFLSVLHICGISNRKKDSQGLHTPLLLEMIQGEIHASVFKGNNDNLNP